MGEVLGRGVTGIGGVFGGGCVIGGGGGGGGSADDKM